MTLLPADDPERSAVPRDFCFDGVVVDQARFRLLVDGTQRAVQPLALRLLLVLCEAEGRVVPRRELFDRLWPRQDIGDESLTQQTARLREALGPYGGRVVTVRRVGLRLDGRIERVDAATFERAESTLAAAPDWPAPSSATDRTEETPDPSLLPRPPRVPRLALSGLALLAVLALLFWLWPSPDAPLLGSQGLTAADLADEKPTTADALQRALALDAQGRRDEAVVLLKITQEADPEAALPAAYLALISEARGDHDDAVRWKRLALQRLQDRPAERVRLLLHPIDPLRNLPDSETMAALSLIATQPDGDEAPSLSRAHAHLARSERSLALAQLQALVWADIDPVNIPVVLGDLASLGAGTQARSLYQTHRAELDASIAAETRARFAATGGDFIGASREIAAALAARPNDRAWVRQSLLALHYALQAGQIEIAETMISGLRRDPRLIEHPKVAFDVAMLQVGLPTLSDADAHSVLTEALTLAQQMEFEPGCWEVALLAALRAAPATFQAQCRTTSADLASVPGLAALLRAASAYRINQPEVAISALQDASRTDIDQGLYAAHANALRQRLGLPTATQPSFDPPYPVWSRHAARSLSESN